MVATCTHVYRIGGAPCGLPDLSNGLCVFHHSRDYTGKTSQAFSDELDRLIDNQNGNWREFIFPKDFSFQDRTLRFPVDMSGSDFDGIKMKGIIFDASFDLSESTFAGKTELYGRFGSLTEEVGNRLLSFRACAFNDEVRFNAKCFTKVNFDRAIFEKGAEFLGGWNYTLHVASGALVSTASATFAHSGEKPWYRRIADFSRSTIFKLKAAIIKGFKKGKTFAVGLGQAIAKKVQNIRDSHFATNVDRIASEDVNVVFYDDVIFDNVQFLCPERVYFRLVCLRRARVDNSDISKVHLIDVDWYQPPLRRSGLFEDAELRLKASPQDYRKALKRLEYQYRSIRRALEGGKMFDMASDFYVGEMDCKRIGSNWPARYFFSIPAFYHALSRYGTDVWVGFRFIVYFVLLHLAITLLISGQSWQRIDLLMRLTDSVRVVTLQRRESSNPNMLLCDTIIRIVGPLQIALIGLSLRSRIRRF